MRSHRELTSAAPVADPAPLAQEGWRARARLLAHPLALVLLFVLCNGALWALTVAPGNAPDELAHYDYIRHLAREPSLPVYGETRSTLNPASFNREAHQPPLYYLPAAPLQALLEGQEWGWQFFGLRLYSTLLTAVTAGLSYVLARALVPGRPAFAAGAAAITASIPMVTFLGAAINNDNLHITLFTAIFVLWALILRADEPRPALLGGLGVLLGLGVLTKLSLAGVAGSGALLLVLATRRPVGRVASFARDCLLVGLPAALLGGWLLARNWWLYGDPMAVTLLNAIPGINFTRPYAQVGTLRAMLTTSQPGYPLFWENLAHGFWGIFDFYSIWMPGRIYWLLDLLLAGAAAALLWRLGRAAAGRERAARLPLLLLAPLGLGALVALLSVVVYCYRIDYQPQGRYMLQFIAPLSIGLLAGCEQLARPLRLRPFVAPALAAVLLAANGIAFVSAIAPTYRDIYLRRAARSDTQVQFAAGPFAARADFVVGGAAPAAIEAPLTIPQGMRGPLVWRLRASDGDDDLATALMDGSPANLIRARLDLERVALAPGRSYTLLIDAPWAVEEGRVTAHLGATGGHLAALGPRLVAAEGSLAERIAGLAGIEEPPTPRNALRLVLLAVVPLVGLAVVTSLLAPSVGRRWRPPIAGLLLAAAVATLAGPPQYVGEHLLIPTRRAVARPGTLATLPTAAPTTAADLILLSGAGGTAKAPPDDAEQRVSAIQPFFFELDGALRPVLAMQPPGAITYRLRLPPGAALQTALALNPAVWQPDKGDGVEFVVRVRAAGAEQELLRRYIDPKRRPEDRRAHAVWLDLAAYGGQEVELVLETLPGAAGDPSYDWGGWVEPLIVRQARERESPGEGLNPP